MKKLIKEAHKGFLIAIILSALSYAFIRIINWNIISLKAIIYFFVGDYVLCWLLMIIAWFVIYRKEKH